MTAREFACGEMVEGCRERPRGERGCAVAAVAEGGAGPQSYSGGGGGSPAAEFIVRATCRQFANPDDRKAACQFFATFLIGP